MDMQTRQIYGIRHLILAVFFLGLARNSLASYDKTVNIPVKYQLKLINLNDWGIPILDRRFIHFNIRCCESLFLTFQSAWNITKGQNLIIKMKPNFAAIMNCVDRRNPACSASVTKFIPKQMFECNKTFLFRADWNHEGWIRLSQGKELDKQGRELISRGGGPEVKELFSFEAEEPFIISYVAVGKFTPDEIQINATYASVLPYNDSKNLHLVVPENTTVGTAVHNLTEFESDVNLPVLRTGTNPGVLDLNGTLLTLAKPLDYEKQRTWNFQMTVKGEILTLTIYILLHVGDVSDNTPKIVCRRPLEMVEELPVGIYFDDWAEVSDLDVSDKHKVTLLNNSYLRMNETTREMTLLRRVDRDGPDGVKTIAVRMTVRDPGSRLAVSYNVSVLDINDNYPAFEKGLYRILMPFSSDAPNNRITHFNITDLDVDQMPGFDLSIEDGNNLNIFYLQDHTLYAHMHKLLDIETLRSRDWTYLLTVKVTDRPKRGTPLTNVTVVFLIIEPPENLQELTGDTSHFEFRELSPLVIPENTSIGHVALRLDRHVTVPSNPLKDRYQYSLYSSHSVCKNGKLGSDYFGIDQYSGAVMVGTALDADTDTGGCPQLQLTFDISDIQTGETQPIANISITVTDVNDNPPVFNQSLTRVVLPCNLNAEQNVAFAALSVSDIESSASVSLESGDKIHYKYSLHYEHSLWVLKMNPTGDSQTARTMADVVKLVALDTGDPQLTSTAVVVIRHDCSISYPGSTRNVVIAEEDTVSATSKFDITSTKTTLTEPVTSSSTPETSSSVRTVPPLSQTTICTTYRVDSKTYFQHHQIPSSTTTQVLQLPPMPSFPVEKDKTRNSYKAASFKEVNRTVPKRDKNDIKKQRFVLSSQDNGGRLDLVEGRKTPQATVKCCSCQELNEFKAVLYGGSRDGEDVSLTGDEEDFSIYIVTLCILILLLLILVILYCKFFGRAT